MDMKALGAPAPQQVQTAKALSPESNLPPKAGSATESEFKEAKAKSGADPDGAGKLYAVA